MAPCFDKVIVSVEELTYSCIKTGVFVYNKESSLNVTVMRGLLLPSPQFLTS